VENQEIVLKDNEAVFVPPHTIHNRRIEPGSQVIVLLYGRNWTPDFADLFARNVPAHYTFHLDDPFRELLMEYAEGHQSVYAAKALLYYACDRFMKGNSLKPQEKKRDDVTVRMLEYIQDNFHEELTLEEFAAKNNFSYHYVSKLVKKSFGISFTELLARCRVDYACSLLSGREHSITQIAGMSGFGSIRNFNRVFLRVTGLTPTEYLEAIGKSTLAGKSLILYENDDCMIPALVRSGVELRDARRYIVGGCWDAITPECSKKFSGEFVNIMRSLELAIHQPEKPLCEDGLTFESLDDIVSFEEFYNAYLRGVEKVVRSKAEKTAEGSRLWHKASPNCIVSALMEPFIPNKLDITAGGGKYNWECNYFSGFPDTVDSLLAVKELCFDKKICTLKDLLDACRNNWPDEQLRRKAIAAPSYGDGTAEAAEMSSKLHDDLYRITRGLPTVYGGEYSIGYNMFNQIIWWGRKMKATPNGRKHGDYLAHGLTPSRLQGNQTITDTLNAIKSIDTEKCSGNSVVNLVLPAKNMNSELFAAFMRSAAESGVQAMQINCVNREELLEAQKDPENHKHIIVRICGFSAPFVSLSPIFQEEFLKRNFY